MPRRRFQPGISNHPKPRGRPTRYPRIIQESRFLSNLPIAEEKGLPIFLMTTKSGVDEHKFYNLLDNNVLRFISTQQFGLTGGSFSGGNTARRLGNNHYVTAERFVWRSADACVTFEPGFEFDTGNYISMSIDAGGRLWLVAEPAVGSNPGYQKIYYSDDDGLSWVESTDLSVIDCVLFDIVGHPTNSNLIIGTGADFFGDNDIIVVYSEDRGGSWQFFSITTGASNFSGFEVKQSIFSPLSQRFLHIDTDVNDPDSFPLSIYYSDDPISGESSYTRHILVQVATSGTDWFNPVMSMAAEGRKIIAIASETHEGGNEETSSHIWISEDDGVSWDEIDYWPKQIWWEDIVAAFYDGDNDRLVVITTGAAEPQAPSTDDSKIWVSKPPGQNWQEITPEEDLEFSAFMVIWR